MAVRGRHATIYKVYDRQKRLVFNGTVAQIAHHFNITICAVHHCIERQGRLLWEYEIVKTNEKEGVPK